jgi:phage tail P2-like protein
MNPLQTPAPFLPYLAADRGVSEWNASADETEKRLTVALSWQIQRQAGTPKALSHAVESLGFTPNILAWYQQRPQAQPYTFDVQAIIGRSWSSGDHNRLIRRINAAKSERDLATITLVHEVHGGLPMTGAAHRALSDGELSLWGALPELMLSSRLNSAGVAQHYTINDYDLRAQP